jgi:hypothetical protein
MNINNISQQLKGSHKLNVSQIKEKKREKTITEKLKVFMVSFIIFPFCQLNKPNAT